MPRTTTSDIFSLVVGQAIRDARRQTGMTQAALAERIGTSAAYVSSVETGRTNPTVGWLSTVASALGAELEIGFRITEPIREPTIPTVPRSPSLTRSID